MTEDDVIICSGASGAIEIALKAMASPGDNILLPKPGFSLYQTIAEQYGIECRYYDLIAEKNWEANLEQMEEKVDEKTKLIFVNNPSNPCGSVYSKEHLEAIKEMPSQVKNTEELMDNNNNETTTNKKPDVLQVSSVIRDKLINEGFSKINVLNALIDANGDIDKARDILVKNTGKKTP